MKLLNRWPRVLLLAALLIFGLAGCGRPPATSSGVEFILNTDTLTPSTTYELRFAETVVAESAVGQLAESSPLLVSPRLNGRFFWLSRSSGVFVPAEPTALDTEYVFTLRSGLRNPAGQPLTARLRQVVRTPALAVDLVSDAGNREDVGALPRVTLAFNAEVQPARIAPHLWFENGAGLRVPARVEWVTLAGSRSEDYESSRGGLATWRQRFAPPGATTAPVPDARRAGTNILAQMVRIFPARPLPVGPGWQLVAARGLPASERGLRLASERSFRLGDVIPFDLEQCAAENDLGAGRRVLLRFSKPLEAALTTEKLPEFISITPAPKHLEYHLQHRGIIATGEFELHRAYRVLVRSNLPSADHLPLGTNAVCGVTFEPLPPRLYFPAFDAVQASGGRRQFELLALNLPKAQLRVRQLDASTLIHTLRGYQSYTRQMEEHVSGEELYQRIDFNLVPGREVYKKTLEFDSEVDATARVALDWNGILGANAPGAVFLQAEARLVENQPRPRVGTQALIQITDLGLVWKMTGGELLVHCFSQQTGLPLGGVTLRAVSEDNEFLTRVVTDAGGLSLLPWPTNATWLLAEKDGDLHALRPEVDELYLYQFDLPSVWGRQEARHLGQIFSDRPVYRPGELVHLKAILRDLQPDGSLAPVPGGSATLVLQNARGVTLVRTNLGLNAHGSVAYDFTLPKDAERGDYQVEIHRQESASQHSFRVADVQANGFAVHLSPPVALNLEGDYLCPLGGRYFLGAPLTQGEVQWSISGEDAAFEPAHVPGFLFAAPRRFGADESGQTGFFLSGQTNLSGGANLPLQVRLPKPGPTPRPRQCQLRMEITDLNQQTIVDSLSFTHHASDFYLGVSELPRVLEVEQPIRLHMVAVGTNELPWIAPVSATAILSLLESHTIRVKGAGGSPVYRTETVVTGVVTQQVACSSLVKEGQNWVPTGPEPLTFVAPQPGLYRLTVAAQDPHGRPVFAQCEFNATGTRETTWSQSSQIRMAMQPDRSSYAPGETARLLIKAPFAGRAWITVERERVRRSFLTNLTLAASVVEIPLAREDAPNVFVSAILLRGAADCPREVREPEFRMGYCELSVVDPGVRLQVAVGADQPSYQPGATVTLGGTARDARGQGVAGAEITLFAVDEGILSLTGFSVENPAEFFNHPRKLQVRSGLSLVQLFTEDPELRRFENKGYLVGGGGEGVSIRERFLACAFWSAGVHTDAAGTFSASFKAPDSLTQYRIVAVAQTTDNRFGLGTGQLRVNKALLIEPGLPLFARRGDQLLARAQVMNRSEVVRTVSVRLQLDELATRDPGTAETLQLTLAPQSSQAVDIPVRLVREGEARWVWSVREAGPGTEGDQVAARLRVCAPLPSLREVHSQVLAPGSASNLLARVDPVLLEGQGRIVVRLANSRLGELAEAAQHLLKYPYGCVEQTSSSLLPWVLCWPRREALRAVDGFKSDAEMLAAIQHGLHRLELMQQESGGLAYWPGQSGECEWGSAYAGLVLTLAHQNGIAVPEQLLEKLQAYLKHTLAKVARQGKGNGRAHGVLMAYDLALAGQVDTQYLELLHRQRADLGVDGRQLLALAWLRVGHPQAAERVTELLALDTGDRIWARMHPLADDARATAIRLLLHTRHNPRDPVAERLASELLQARQKGHWQTTQGNAWALYALMEYLDQVESRPGPQAGEISLGAERVPYQLPAQPAWTEVSFPLPLGDAHAALTVRLGSQPLHAQVVVEAQPRLAQLAPLSRGFTIRREYVRLDAKNQEQPATNLVVGDRVLVKLALQVAEDSLYVAIEDPLPAVLEATVPSFVTRGGADLPVDLAQRLYWYDDFHELRADRALFFRDHLPAGDYLVRYVTRVRAAGDTLAAPAKVEAMYRPDRLGTSAADHVRARPSN
jgi:uncharacterized protein YfaS (alpha-2-macroglobulin family)